MSRYPEVGIFSLAFAEEYRSFMEENDVSGTRLAEQMGRGVGYVSERVNGKRPLNEDDVEALAALVDGWNGVSLLLELLRRVAERAEPGPNRRARSA
ncbi:hypothetical protein [Leucobacter sp. wl10]|uniref:hypothetical protein n=1 Tax=Leucobacter sp. wl10 TaxID=2304677 RepID=UPI0013C2E139|nr:hypothetical protein [Leucobacter sp. wl10]